MAFAHIAAMKNGTGTWRKEGREQRGGGERRGDERGGGERRERGGEVKVHLVSFVLF